MISVKGTFRDRVAQPVEPIEGRDGEPVVIMFIDKEGADSTAAAEDTGWAELEQSIVKCQIEIGITDLAEQHDHYLYGKYLRPPF